MKRGRGKTTLWRALLAAVILSVPAGASAAAPVVGLGIGLGEQGLVGASLRLRPWEPVGVEAGVGAYYYNLRGSGEDLTGYVPAYGGEVVLYATPRERPAQHGLTLVLQYTEVTGLLCGFGYRYEYYLNNGRTGFHFEVGDFFLHPGGRARARHYYEKKSDSSSGDDLDYTFIPLLLKMGVQF